MLALLLVPDYSNAQSSCASNTTTFNHDFESGASWDLCWTLDQETGLALEQVTYGAPGDQPRRVLDRLNLAAALLHYDDETEAANLMHTSLLERNADQTLNLQQSDATNCEGTILQGSTLTHTACVQNIDAGNLIRFAALPTLRRQVIVLSASFKTGAHTVNVRYNLSEDGQIDPAVDFSGRINRFGSSPAFGNEIGSDRGLATNGTLFFTWRMDFNINGTPDNDVIDEYQFDTGVTALERKLAKKSRLTVETFRPVAPEVFRGWHITDLDQSAAAGGFTRIGYYLDPQQSGFAYRNQSLNWAQFDFFVTRNRSCEKLAFNNDPDCGSDLDDFVDGELLEGADPVLWFSLTRRFTPDSADWPAIRSRTATFSLIPFDWSVTSPFSDASVGAP